MQPLPRVKPTRGAPSFLHEPVYYNSGILIVDGCRQEKRLRARANLGNPPKGNYSPRPVRIIFHPSLSLLSTSGLVSAVTPHATLWALQAARIV
jgi:hypothetical protein